MSSRITITYPYDDNATGNNNFFSNGTTIDNIDNVVRTGWARTRQQFDAIATTYNECITTIEADNWVTTDRIADNAVTSDKVNLGAVNNFQVVTALPDTQVTGTLYIINESS